MLNMCKQLNCDVIVLVIFRLACFSLEGGAPVHASGRIRLREAPAIQGARGFCFIVASAT
jgi:hypothetical protein